MEVKKSPKADLEGKKTIFLEIGFVIALGILLSAFNWKTNTKVEEGFVITQEEQVEEEIIPITQQMMKPCIRLSAIPSAVWSLAVRC